MKLIKRITEAALYVLISIAAVGAIVTPVFMSINCATVNGTNQLDVARVANIAGLAAQMGSTAYLQKNPDDRSYFIAVYNGLGALDHAGNYDPAQFAAALQALPIKELSGPNGSLYVLAAIFLWDELAQQSYQLDSKLWVKPVLVAVRAGIGRALGIAPGTRQKGLIP